MVEEDNGNGELTEMEKAIHAKTVCGTCVKHFPPSQPIPLVIPPLPGAIARPNTMTAVPVILCHNPKSPKFMQILSVQCSCEYHATASKPVPRLLVPNDMEDDDG